MIHDVTVSIIMPAYNSGAYIRDAVRSVLGQVYDEWELLIIDDGSTDDTGVIADEYAAVDERIRVFHLPNGGVSRARNAGLDAAVGKWVIFLDSDDMLEDDCIVRLLEGAGDNDLVIGNHCTFPDASVLKPHLSKQYDSLEQLREDAVDLFLDECFWTVWGKLFKRESIEERFDEGQSFGEDTLFFMRRLGKCARVKKIDTVVYRYRTGNNASLSSDRGHIRAEYIETICKEARMTLGDKVIDYLHVYYLRHFFIYVRYVLRSLELSRDEKIRLVNEAVNNGYFLSIPLKRLRLYSREMHWFMVLKSQDYDLIEKEMI